MPTVVASISRFCAPLHRGRAASARSAQCVQGRETKATRTGADSLGAYVDPEGLSLSLQSGNGGPLSGKTCAVKDMYDIAGLRTGFGQPDWSRTVGASAEPSTAPAVAAWIAAGAVFTGKTQMDELAFSLNGENAHYGTPVNARAPGRIPGGSSSGSAAVVAAGLVDIALGSDTGGSVRVPASYCGIFGIRPTWGIISLDGARPLAPSFDTVGWFADSAEDLQLAGEMLLKGAPGPTKLRPRSSDSQLRRLLIATDAFAKAEGPLGAAMLAKVKGEVAKGFDKAVELTIATQMAPGGFPALLAAFRQLQMREVWQAHGEWITATKPAFGPGTAERFAMSAQVTDAAVAESNAVRDAARERLRAILGQDGVLALPAAPGPAPLLRTPPPELDAFRQRLLELTCLAGLSGFPQLSVPLVRLPEGPVGLGLIGPPGSDLELLELATKLQQRGYVRQFAKLPVEAV